MFHIDPEESMAQHENEPVRDKTTGRITTILPPVDDWFNESDDHDLVEELAGVITTLGELGVWIATGALARHERTLHTKNERDDFLTQISKGILPPEDPQRAWVRALPGEHIDALLESALLQVALLMDEVEAMQPLERVSAPRWVRLCEQRDDLESLLAIIAVRGEDSALTARVASLDEDAASVLETQDALANLTPCVRLGRALVQYPEAWWVAAFDTGSMNL